MISSSEAFKFWIRKYVVIFPFPFTWISPLSTISNPWFSRALHREKINAPGFKDHSSITGELATIGWIMREEKPEAQGTQWGSGTLRPQWGGERRKA